MSLVVDDVMCNVIGSCTYSCCLSVHIRGVDVTYYCIVGYFYCVLVTNVNITTSQIPMTNLRKGENIFYAMLQMKNSLKNLIKTSGGMKVNNDYEE